METKASLWVDTTPPTSYPRLERPESVDVVIVGGGITGLTAAYLLVNAGLAVAVLEADRIAMGTTGNTTAKVTALHGLPYAALIKEHGEERARHYANANTAGIREIARIVDAERIACD